jgi:diacylglycerol kinase family enzyme
MSRCILVLNRASGANQRGMDAAAVSRTVETAFREAGHEVSSLQVAPQAIEAAISQAVSRAPDLIVIGGGDGTVSTAARLLGGTGIALGILPLGTFNLAARDLGVPLEIEAAAQFLATAEAHPIDVMEVSGHSCLCTTILGFYPEFSHIFENREDHGGHWWKKTLTVLSQLRKTFRLARPLRLRWHCAEGEGRARSKFAAFVPGRYQESAGLIPARTDFRCGTLSAYIGTQDSAASALRGILDYTLGRQEKNPELQVFHTADLTLSASRRRHLRVMLDGEILRLKLPVHLRILPLHLNVLTRPERLLTGSPTSS